MAKGLLTDDEELRKFNAIEAQAQPWYARALPMEGRATFLPFRDSMPGSVFNQRELAVPGLIAEAANAITAPARSLLGTDPEFEAGKEGVNMALNVMGGGLGSSRAMRNPTGDGGVDLAMGVASDRSRNIKSLNDPVLQLTKEEFLGKPKIVSPKGSSDLEPRLLTTNESATPEPFMGGKYKLKISEDGAAVLDKDKVVASYNFGDALVVDPKYRKKGIAEELVINTEQDSHPRLKQKPELKHLKLYKKRFGIE